MIPVVALVVAKAPVPGLAKTRLAASIGDRAAADIAAAALLDTLDAVAAAPVQARVVAMTGDLDAACASDEIRSRLDAFTVVPQRGDDFAERLANAHVDAAAAAGNRRVLQIGMDTPQVSAEMHRRMRAGTLGTDAVLGLADDGGWWVLGVSDASMADCLREVPMSRPDTGALTLAALYAKGFHVDLVAELADVDTIDDIDVGAADVRGRQPVRPRHCGRWGSDMLGNLYDRALDGERCWIRRDDGEVSNLPVRRWLGGRDADDQFDSAVVGLCSGPTIDLGCGPGRLVTELVRRGVPALGVDQSATAVGLARRSGAPVLRRDVFDPLPATGRWQTVLLADGNVGLGGDPLRVLRRAAELLRRGGRCIAEFDSVATGIRTGWVQARVIPDGRTLVPVGVGRHRLRGRARRGGRAGADRRSTRSASASWRVSPWRSRVRPSAEDPV